MQYKLLEMVLQVMRAIGSPKKTMRAPLSRKYPAKETLLLVLPIAILQQALILSMDTFDSRISGNPVFGVHTVGPLRKAFCGALTLNLSNL